MYKLIAIDLDGTLLNSSGEVTENTKRALKKAIDQGIEIVIASRKND
ncbi:MAG: HAD hydrolase family protein [Clostridia bacterium]|nr:HAD hydrolase family protein [Clostridia bacterium]